MASIEETIALLRSHPDDATRYAAVGRLAANVDDPRVLEALIQALGDPGSYELPEPDAPPLVYGVSEHAKEILGPIASKHFSLLATQMRSNPEIMRGGLSLLPHCGMPGVELLAQAAELDHKEIPAAVARTIGSAIYYKVDEALEPALRDILIRLLVHPDVSARFHACDVLSGYFRSRPHLDPLEVLPEGNLALLAQKVRDGETLPKAGAPFVRSDLMLDALVDAAARGGYGGAETAYLLLAQAHRLTSAQISRLIAGSPTDNLLGLWAALGKKAGEAVPRLLELLEHPNLFGNALTALLRIDPGAAPLPLLEKAFMQDENARSGIVEHHPLPEKLAAAVIPRLLEQWHEISERCKATGRTPYTSDLAPWRGMQALGSLMQGELPFLMSVLKPYVGWNTSRSYAIGIIGSLGAAARPAFPQLLALLGHHHDRGSVLKALAQLGPLARDPFLAPLRELELESRSWTDWQRNYWRNSVVAALNSVASPDGIPPNVP